MICHHRSENFPAGLRVLVVDDDPTWLKILEKMLKKCSYEVTTRNLATEAMMLLRERRNGFDIVISDVNMPDMDGFKLLELVGLEMDLPVIMMSVDGETSRVMKGVQHGACDYLLKPIRMKELRNIWQHVVRKRMQEARDVENNEMDRFDEAWMLNGIDIQTGKKRKDFDYRDEKEMSDSKSSDTSFAAKKPRVVWTVDLHQKFVKAVNQIGFDKVGPKKILDLMGVPWLTRENVASHLQKYRLYLTRLRKENELKASSSGIKNPDLSPKESSSSMCLQNLLDVKPNKSSTNTKYTFPGEKVFVQEAESRNYKGEVKAAVLSSTAETNTTPVCENFDSSTKATQNASFAPANSDLKCWAGDVSKTVFEHEFKQQIQAPDDDTRAPGLDLPLQKDINNTGESIQSKPADINTKNPEGVLANLQDFDQTPSTTWNTKTASLDHILMNGLESVSGSAFALWDKEFGTGAFQGELHTPFNGLQSTELLDYGNTNFGGDVQPYLYDYEYPIDPVIDHSLFIL